MARKGKTFNSLRRPKLLRKEITSREAGVGVLVIGLLGAMTWWLAEQRDSYDPGERDIAVAVLERDSVADTLYKPPLQRWRDPTLGDAAPVEDVTPFPSTILDGGWRTTSRVETFTPENLYEKINGQAEQYVKFGFRELKVVALTDPSGALPLDLFLYDQGTLANALGLYAEQRGRRKKLVISEGNVRFSPSSLGASGMVGRYVFHAIGTEPNEAVAAKARQIASALNGFAKETELPLPYRILHEALGIPFERLGYTPVNAFQFEFGTRFWFGAPEPDSQLSAFLHAATTPEEAQALYTKFHNEQSGEFEVIEAVPGNAIYQHQFLKTFFVLRLEGSTVFGVEGAASREAATAVVAQLRNALAGGGREEGDQ